MAKQKHTGLGRGLGSLIPKGGTQATSSRARMPLSRVSANSAAEVSASAVEIIDVPVGQIVSNRHQPRKYFAEKALQELAASIKEHGILQPLVVIEQDGAFELVAGERRLRAAKIAGLAKVPVIVRVASELERLELALIENIQRADLNPIEEAESYQKLNDEFGLTHEQVAKRVGRSRPAITNAIRMLSLPGEIQKAIAEAQITEGHAKVLMEIKDEEKRLALFRRVLSEKLTITDTAQEVKKVSVARHARRVTKDPNTEAYEQKLRDSLGTKVSIKKRGKHAGIIVIEYYGEDEFAKLIELLG